MTGKKKYSIPLALVTGLGSGIFVAILVSSVFADAMLLVQMALIS